MRLVTFAGLRAHKSRLVAVSLAVMLAVAFMSATLLLSSSAKATLTESLGAEMRKADLVVQSFDNNGEGVQITDEHLKSIAGFNSVAEAASSLSVGVELKSATRTVPFAMLTAALPDSLEPTVLETGSMPASFEEIVLDDATAKLLQLKVGDSVTVTVDQSFMAEGGTQDFEKTLVGISKQSSNPFMGAANSALTTTDAYAEVSYADGQEAENYDEILVKLQPGSSEADFLSELNALEFLGYVDDETVVPLVQTPTAIVNDIVKDFSSGSDVLTGVLLAFVAIALLVAGLVISNTFSVLVAQRSRELALLRCVGASNKQVQRSVLTEALIMSLIASALGVLLAIAIMSGLILLAQKADFTGGIGTFAIGAEAIIWPILAGVVVTLIAASGPAREATRVAPLEALRAKNAEVVTKKGGIARLIGGLIFTVTGFALIVMGLNVADPLFALALAVLGSILSAIGILMLAVFIIPPTTYALGRAVFAKGVPGKLATLNSVRNPKRSTATASALLIGVTLVATVYTGAEVARATLHGQLDSAFPIDMAVEIYNENTEITAEQITQLKNLESVAEVVTASSNHFDTTPSGLAEVWGISPDEFALVSNNQNIHLDAETAFIGSPLPEGQETIELATSKGSVTLTAKQEGAPRGIAVVTPENFEKIAADSGPKVALIKTIGGLSSTQLLDLREEVASIVPESYQMSEGVERAIFDDIISMMLLIVTALLAVAVIIAVIGIGNTLSLSVIERTRENALLRALGLTRAGMRGMLASEALLTALTAAVLGVALGVCYGFIGAKTILNSVGEVTPVVPWQALLIIIGLAIVAGLLASVLPARRALKLTPVEGLRGV